MINISSYSGIRHKMNSSRDSIKSVLKLPHLQVSVSPIRLRLMVRGCLAKFYFWTKNPKASENCLELVERSSAGDLIHLLQGLLKYDPKERLTAHEAFRHPFFVGDQLSIFR